MEPTGEPKGGSSFGEKVALWVVVAGIVVVLCWMFCITPVLSKSVEKAPRVNCASNLKKQFGLGLLMYSGEYGGWFPPTPPGNNFEPLNTLNILPDGKVYGCPLAMTLATVARQSNYCYVGSGIRDDVKDAAHVVLAYDRSGNHPDNQWMTALFADGHVEGAKPDGTKGWNTYRADRPH